MRVTILYLLGLLALMSFIWVTFSGFKVLALFLICVFIGILILTHCDLLILLFIGAREIQDDDYPILAQIVSQEAYKLSVLKPKLFFYHGHIDRAFVFHQGRRIHLVLGKSLLQSYSEFELRAIVFELLLQAKKKMASKKTKMTFMLIFLMGIIHFVVSMLFKILPFPRLKQAIMWFIFYSIYPPLEVIFKLVIGQGYFKKLSSYLQNFQVESENWEAVKSRLSSPDVMKSLSYKKLMIFFNLSHRDSFQNIFVLESLPHEWDALTGLSEKSSVS